MHNKICPSLAGGDTTKYLRRFTCLKEPFLTEIILSRLKSWGQEQFSCPHIIPQCGLLLGKTTTYRK
jgi:hypothetical protein